MEPLVPIEKLRYDLKRRWEELRDIARKAKALGIEIERANFEVMELELKNSGGKKRRRKRGTAKAEKGPSVVEIAIEILASRGSPMPCMELAAAIAARGIDCGNNARSLRMSASKGKKLKGLPGDVITLP